MPKKVHECVKKLKAEGKPEKNAWAICYHIQNIIKKIKNKIKKD